WVLIRRLRAGQAVDELTSLNVMGLELLRAQLSVDDLVELVYRQAGQIVPTDNFQLGLFDHDAYAVKVWVRRGERQEPTVFPEGGRQGIAGMLRETAQPLLIHNFDAERDRLPAPGDSPLEHRFKSGVFVPLIAGKSVIGLIVATSEQPSRFDEEQLHLLTALANLAAAAIRNAQLYESAQHRAEQLNLIAQVSAQVSTVQPLRDLFEQFVTLTKETFGYYYVGIFVLDDDRLVVGATTDPDLDELVIKPGEGMVGWAAQQGEPALASNVEKDPRYRQVGVLPQTRSEVAIPLKVEGRVLGVLDVQSDQEDAFNRED